jgi:predicted DNA-binding protein (MmcQ/YjbR family)
MDIETLRAICLALPGTTEDVKWGADLCFSIGEKMYCVTGFEMPTGATLKVPDADFDELCSRPGFAPAPYLARAKWILVEDLDNLNKAEWQFFIKQSYELVKSKLPKRLQKMIDAQNGQ